MNGFKLAFDPNLSYLQSSVLPKKHPTPTRTRFLVANLLAKQIIRECLPASPDTPDFGGFFPVLLENSMVFTAGTSPGQKTAWFIPKCKLTGAFSLYGFIKVCQTTKENYYQSCFFDFEDLTQTRFFDRTHANFKAV